MKSRPARTIALVIGLMVVVGAVIVTSNTGGAEGNTLDEAMGALDTVLQYAGTVAFAISGALMAGRKGMDIVGVIVLGSIVAIGGGTVRDLLIGASPIFWIDDPGFVIVAALTAIATIPLAKSGLLVAIHPYHVIAISDAAGMALFVITGTNIALDAGADSFAAALVGVISGVGGGIIRDTLANEIPDVLMNSQFYASAAFIGALVYVLLLDISVSPLVALWAPVLVIFALRTSSLILGWGVPSFDLSDDEDPASAGEASDG